ncbi:unnamed protein product [Mytilus coruscus]|uniref:Uncharacterized protein n=1 Tax=Mytilus coruscus TaxID=42192 RepID=A0A6J8BLV2_MYTCO|nr:unnamed protein product [Mytilus coruscus]
MDLCNQPDPAETFKQHVSAQLSLSDSDIDKIAEAVESKWVSTFNHMLQKIVDFEIKSLKRRVEQLEIDRNLLMEKVDRLEQYGIPENAGENTDLIVRSLFKEIDPDFNDLDVERTHRNGPLSPPNSNTPTDEAADCSKTSAEFITEQTYDNNKTRSEQQPCQIMVRVLNPNTKIRILRCRKHLKSSRNYNNVYINEDLNKYRNRLYYHTRCLTKQKGAKQCWTVNGKIYLKETNGTVYYINTAHAFNEAVIKAKLDYEYLSVDMLMDPSY